MARCSRPSGSSSASSGSSRSRAPAPAPRSRSPPGRRSVVADVLLLSDLTRRELFEAAMFARACIVLDEAARAGVLDEPLIEVDVERCHEILGFAAHHGIAPDDRYVDTTVIELIGKAAACG